MTTVLTHADGHDGTLQDDCDECALIMRSPCDWCGYGRAFLTHNPEAHAENGDPMAELFFTEAMQ